MVFTFACGSPDPPRERLDSTALWVGLAPAKLALTFARRGREVLLVEALIDESVEARRIEGAEDPIELLSRAEAADVRRMAARGERLVVPLRELGVPVDLGVVHIAAGANFREHGDEIDVDEPFLFPKLAEPTRWCSEVPAAARLDYEVELCFAPLSPISSADAASTRFGVLLCNDFTDRWTLAKGMLMPGAIGTRGFADGKGRPGFLPVGAFFVVPDDLDAFLAGVTLELWVDGELRQRSAANEMIWDLRRLVAESFARSDLDYHHAQGLRRILPEPGRIPARALLLSGTPGGVIFALPTLWRGSLYLQPGDEVIARATQLGALRNRVAR
jgi:2-keto-4-pentenoate hydratase/2-oxohepta-3-ene-1,7-dioic acid hydratase in catechol pathway